MSRHEGSSAPDSADGLRPLPPTPNLESERKRAKKLLRDARAGDAEALKRVLAPRARLAEPGEPNEITLADAQFALAREYGFASWPRLVTYFETWERHQGASPRSESPSRKHYDWLVQQLLRAHGARRAVYGQLLATFVPRFYGRPDDEIFASSLSETEAQLVVARMSRYSNWEALLAHVASAPPESPVAPISKDIAPAEREAAMLAAARAAREADERPFVRACVAVEKGDFEALVAIVAAHPELLKTPTAEKRTESLLRNALLFESHSRTPEARRISDWLVSRGSGLQATLNWMLVGCFRATVDDVRFLLERGADPTWEPPDGISVLEHALLRYWNPEPVDLIASRVVPREAFWISAGLGDVRGFLRYLDKDGKPTNAARRNRPDFTAVGPSALPSSPDADDHIILWEAFLVAGLNQRPATLDALLNHGFPIDAAPWGQTLLHLGVGNRIVPLVEYLVKRGASVEVKGDHPNASTREMAEELYRQNPGDALLREIYDLCRRE